MAQQIGSEATSKLAPSSVDGEEALTLRVTWVNGNRDRIVIEHQSVNDPNQEIVVSGRSANDTMKTIAQFFDYELECADNSFIFKFR